MTAINIVLRKRSVAIFSDTAWYDGSGRVVMFAPKTRRLEGMDAFLAFRGGLNVFDHIEQILTDIGSVDGIISDNGAALHEVIPAICGPDAKYDLYLAGWTAEGPVARFLSTETGEFGWNELPEPITVAPMPDISAVRAVGLTPPTNTETFDLVEFATKLIEAQRLTKFPFPWRSDLAKLHGVGGSAELFTVNADGVQEHVLTHWRDEVGELITPAQQIAAQPMNRQQRRAAEREARKRAA